MTTIDTSVIRPGRFLRVALALLLLVVSARPLLAQGTGVVRGRVVDAQTGEPVQYAAVAIHQQSDSTLLTGGLTDANGAFNVPGVRVADVYVSVRFVGYTDYSSESFRAQGAVDRGEIRLRPVAVMLEGLEVTGEEAAQLHRPDRQVFDAGQFQAAQGGTATDVLRNLPSVSVTADGQVSVRGATGFMIMINGRPVQGDPAVILQQLAANAIDDVEVITAPSAKYDPDGKAGIINIKTRQTSLDGFFLVANTRYGLPSVETYDNAETSWRYGADATANYRSGRWELATGLDYRRDDLTGRRVGYVNTLVDGLLTELPSDGERSFDREDFSGRVSLAFTATPNDAIRASVYAGKRTHDRLADILYDYQQTVPLARAGGLHPRGYWDLFQQNGRVLDNAASTDSLRYFNHNSRVRRGDFFIGGLDYSHAFADGSTLAVAGLYEHTILGGPTENVDLGGPLLRDTLTSVYNDNDNPLDGVRLQLDYARGIGGGDTRWESGYQYRHLKHPGTFRYDDLDLATGGWVRNPEFSNTIGLTRTIHSLYSQFSGAWDRLTYTAGLRMEYFDRAVSTARPDTTYILRQLNPFPSFNLHYEVGGGLAARGAYSRRIERTTTSMMTPFPEREHSETLEQGDAELLPEYIDLAELGLVKEWDGSSVFTTAYLRDVENPVNRVNTVYDATALNRIYTNVGTGRAVGLEVGATLHPTDWWRLALGGNVYNYRLQGSLFGDEIDTASTIHSVNVNSNFKISSSFGAQFALNYLSERITAQGVDSRFYNPSLTLQKSFIGDRMAITLQWLNMDLGLLNSNEQRITTWDDDFFTTTNYIHEVDMLTLGFRYQLNQPSKKVKLIESEFGNKEF